MSLKKKKTLRANALAYSAKVDLHVAITDWARKNTVELTRSCSSCVYAVKDGPFRCALYNATPPIDVIMDGCDSYFDIDDIPF